MVTFRVSSGGWHKTIKADNAELAVIRAIKKDMPKHLGRLIEIRQYAQPTLYWDVREALRRAKIKFGK